MSRIADLKVKIFADGADYEGIVKMSKNPVIKGFTTNPTLMRKAGVSDYEAFKEVMEGRPGFVVAPWCGSPECEAQIKTDTQATIRNMPLNAATPSGRCVRGDNPARFEAWFAKAY